MLNFALEYNHVQSIMQQVICFATLLENEYIYSVIHCNCQDWENFASAYSYKNY